MRRFLLAAHGPVFEYLEQIAEEMIESFGIPYREAVARVNNHWADADITEVEDLIFHELPGYWSMIIYYREVEDWSPEADRANWRIKPAPHVDSPSWTV